MCQNYGFYSNATAKFYTPGKNISTQITRIINFLCTKFQLVLSD